MNFQNKSTAILLSAVTVFILSIVISPEEGGFYLHFFRGLVLICVIWAFILFITSQKKNYSGKLMGDELKQVDSPKNSESDNELQDRYKYLLHSIFNTIRSINPDYQGAAYIIDHDKNGFALQSATSNEFSEFVPHDQEILTTILKQKEVQVLRYNKNRDGWTQLFSERTWRGSECILGIRIVNKDISVGCLLMTVDHFSKTQERDREILFNLGDLLSLGIAKIEKIEELLADNSYQDRIFDLFNTVDIFSDEEVLYDSIQTLCHSLFSYDKFTIAMVDLSDNSPVVKLVDGIKEDVDASDTFSLDFSLHGKVIKDGIKIRSRYWDNDYPELGRFRKDEDFNINFSAVLIVPILMKGISIGSIALERLTSRSYSSSDERLMEHLAFTVGHFLSWQEGYRKMHESAIHDGLTGLLNHRAFMNRFEDEVRRAIRFQQKHVLVVLDLDKFKRINDTHGHLYGDYVIKQVGKILQDSVRNIDVVARYGGEEFMIILVDTSQTHSLTVTQRIVNNIEKFKFSLDGINEKMTISAGMAEFPKDSDNIKILIEKADKAMYKAKKLGGNNVAVCA